MKSPPVLTDSRISVWHQCLEYRYLLDHEVFDDSEKQDVHIVSQVPYLETENRKVPVEDCALVALWYVVLPINGRVISNGESIGLVISSSHTSLHPYIAAESFQRSLEQYR